MFGRSRILKAHLRQRFVVTLKSGDAFEGLVMDADSSILVLVDAHMQLKDGSVPVDGSLFVQRADIAYMQLPRVAPMLDGAVVRCRFSR